MDSPLLDIANALTALANDRLALPVPVIAPAPLFVERRAHVRLRPFDLPGPLLVRLENGAELTLVDISASGALVETEACLNTGADFVLELSAPGAQRTTMVPSRVTRSQITGVDTRGALRYRTAFAFKQLLPLAEVAAPEEPDFPIEDAPALADAIADIRSVASGSSDLQVTRLLSEIVRQARVCGSVRALMVFVEERLRRHVPLLAVAFGTRPRARTAPADCLSFELGHSGDGLERMHVEFRPACELDDEQMRLLHAGASVMSLIHGWHRTPFPAR